MTWIRRNLWVWAWLGILVALWFLLGRDGWALPRDGGAAGAWPTPITAPAPSA